MTAIRLTWAELMQAAICGVMRHITSLRDKRPDRHGADLSGDGWSLHIEGAAGEIAFARARGCYWSSSVNTFSLPDVGDVQVRTRSRHDYELIVRDCDKDGDVFALVTGRAPEFVVRGWIRGGDAKRKEWRREHGGREAAFFVPQAELHPWMDEDVREAA